MNDSKKIESGVIFQGDNNQILCLAGRTLIVKLAAVPKNREFIVTAPLTIESCSGEGKLTVTGGPINVYEPLTLTENVTVSGDIEVKTYSPQTGSLTVGAGSTVNRTITVESGCTADIYGTVKGTITVEEGGTLNLYDGAEVSSRMVTSGVCTINGGTVKGITVNGGVCTITGGTIQNNKNENGNGGGVYVAGGTCTISGGSITSNTAKNGGGVYVAGGATCWLRERSVVLNNNATGNGGGIYAGEGVRINMSAGTLRYNTASNGGGVYLSSGAKLASYAQFRENSATGAGGGIWAASGCTIYLNGNENYRGLLSGNTAARGSGMYVVGAQWTVEFNGTLVYDNNDLHFLGDGSNSKNYGVLRIGDRGDDESIISGNIKAINVDVTMDKGTVQSGSVTLENAKWLIYGGYCSISKFTTDGQQKVTLYGGYFDAPPSDKDNILVGNTDNPCKILEISGKAGDANYDPAYKEGYSYGVYAVKNDAASLNQGTITYDSQPVVPGEDFTIAPNGTTLLEYSCTDAAGSPVSGWPTNAGAYTIQAKCLNAVEKWYAETSFDLTIAKATPTYTEPTGLTARLGKPLSDVALPQGWAWKDGSTVPEQEETQTFPAVYTPADTANYNTVELDLTVQVEHAHRRLWFLEGHSAPGPRLGRLEIQRRRHPHPHLPAAGLRRGGEGSLHRRRSHLLFAGGVPGVRRGLRPAEGGLHPTLR